MPGVPLFVPFVPAVPRAAAKTTKIAGNGRQSSPIKPPICVGSR